MYVALQIVGMVALVLGGQGAIRQLVNHDDGGILTWIPGGWGVHLIVYLILVAAGLLLAGWANGKWRGSKERS